MTDFFRDRRMNAEKLLRYGFVRTENGYLFQRELMEGEFILSVHVAKTGEVGTELSDVSTGEPYSLHLVPEASGEFVGRVRSEYERALSEIAERCFDPDVFREEMIRALIGAVRERYGNEPEYLWEKFPDNAVWRREDNGKWYGAILSVRRDRLGLEGEEKIRVLNVRADPREVPLLIDKRTVFPGWHMNKKHWISLLSDGSVPLEILMEFLEESRHLAGGT